MGAKNYLFFGSAEAGVHNALLYTLIENCKLQGLDPERYLAEVIDRLPEHPIDGQAARVRYFADGLAFGSAEFLEGVFMRKKRLLGVKRQWSLGCLGLMGWERFVRCEISVVKLERRIIFPQTQISFLGGTPRTLHDQRRRLQQEADWRLRSGSPERVAKNPPVGSKYSAVLQYAGSQRRTQALALNLEALLWGEFRLAEDLKGDQGLRYFGSCRSLACGSVRKLDCT